MYRALLIGPIVCTLIGGAAGVSSAMLYRQYPLERAHVHIDDSLPLLVGGAALGGLAGACVFAACRRWPRVVPALTVLATTALGAAIAAPLGWIAGDLRMERMPRQGMSAGAAVGAVGGLLVGLAQSLVDWRRRRAESAARRRLASMAIPRVESGGDGPRERVREAQKLLLRLGRKRFGPPGSGIELRVCGIQDLARLEMLSTRLLEVADWQRLFQDES